MNSNDDDRRAFLYGFPFNRKPCTGLITLRLHWLFALIFLPHCSIHEENSDLDFLFKLLALLLALAISIVKLGNLPDDPMHRFIAVPTIALWVLGIPAYILSGGDLTWTMTIILCIFLIGIVSGPPNNQTKNRE